jgi:hypothetical protein
MKLLKVLIALVVVWIGILGLSSAAPVAVASGMLKATGIGQLDFGLTYEPGTATTVTYPIITAAINNGALSVAFTKGASITNAKQINSYMLAQADGGDRAESQLDVLGTNGNDATVKNYNMYGYVTNNFAYAGQYADSITGESIDLNSQSWNKGAAVIEPIDQPSENGAPTGALVGSYLGSQVPYTKDADSKDQGIDRATVFPTTGTNQGESYAEKYAANKGSTDTTLVTISTAYQFAQAGGSLDPSAYPMGMWTQAVNDKGAKMTGVIGGTMTDRTGTTWFGTNGQAASAAAGMTYSGLGTLSPNAQEMGYADKNIVYADKDTLRDGNALTPHCSTTSYTNLNGIPHSTSDSGGNTPWPCGSNELFVYSIVNAAHPNGLSTHIFY